MRKREATAWKWFSTFIKIRDCLETTKTIEYGICITCKGKFERKGSHAGHFIHDKKSTYYDERNVHLQCVRCNKYLDGNRILYTLAMQKKYGQEVVEELIRKSNQEIKQFKKFELKEMAKQYRLKVKKLLNE